MPTTSLRSGEVQSRIMDALTEAGDKGLTARELVEKIYGDREDGGPEWADTVVYVTAKRLRDRKKIDTERAHTVYKIKKMPGTKSA